MTDPEVVPLLVRVRQALLDTPLPLAAADADTGRRTRAALLTELDDHLLSRLIEVDAPLLVVVGGSTGAGKSTLVNSLIGAAVTEAGVLRPTTRSPVLVHHPDDARWFGDDRLLPGLGRVHGPSLDAHTLRLVASDAVPPGIAIVDAPDVDSVERANREVAAELLAAADLWLFVTSAARYADQVPWNHLRDAGSRGTEVALILDRTAPDVIREVGSHLSRLLEARGLRGAPLFMVPETVLDGDGLLPDDDVAQLRDWLRAIAADEQTRAGVVRATADRAMRLLPERLETLSSSVRTQERVVSLLHDEVTAAFAPVLEAVDPTQRPIRLDGPDVAAAAAELTGPRGRTRGVEARVARVQHRLRARRDGRHPTRDVVRALDPAVTAFVVDAVETAVERTAAAWRVVPSGAALLAAATDDLGRGSDELRRRVADETTMWLDHVRRLVESSTGDRRPTALVGLGPSGLTAALALATVAGPIDEALERGSRRDADPLDRAAQLVVEAAGESAARMLVHRSALDLRHRLRRVVRAERSRFTLVLDHGGVQLGGADRMQQLARDLIEVGAPGRAR